MPTDPVTLLLWLMLTALALAAVAAWLRNRNRSSNPPEEVVVTDPPPAQPEHGLGRHWGRDYKVAVGSAGIKSLVREARMEEAYQIRSASETAFEAYADFDKQQERIAVANRPPGPGFLVVSDTLEARSPLSEGLGNRTPAGTTSTRSPRISAQP
jgi:hypothetical protein